jgi:hypothetical protein
VTAETAWSGCPADRELASTGRPYKSRREASCRKARAGGRRVVRGLPVVRTRHQRLSVPRATRPKLAKDYAEWVDHGDIGSKRKDKPK